MAWSILATLDTPTAGAFTFTGLSLGSVKRLRVQIWGVTVTNDGTDLGVQYSIGSAFITSGYTFVTHAETSSSSNNPDSATSVASLLLCGNDANWDTGNAATKGVQSDVYISNPGSTSKYKQVSYRTAGQGPTANCVFSTGCGHVANAGAIDGIKVNGTSNLLAGYVRLWTI